MFGPITLTKKSLTALQLDTSNPRLLGYKKQGKLQSEKDIITLMMARYGIRDLITSILSNGFYPDEILYAIPDEAQPNKRIIVEGNRRLTACKIIKKPSILKGTPYSAFISRIERHPNYLSAVETIKKLNLVELSSRSAARTYIASKHTKESIKRWSVYTQGAYYIDLLTEFNDINALRASINNSVPTSRIKGVILFTRLTDQILTLPTLSEDEKNKLINDIDSIKTEAVFRLIQRSDFKTDIAKISLSKEGELVVRKINTTAYNHVLAKLARDSNFSKKLTTRQENEDVVQAYIGELKDIIAQFSSPSDLNDPEENEEDESTLDLSDDDTEDTDETEEPNEGENEDQNGGATYTPPKPTVKTITRKKVNTLLKKLTPITYNHNKIDDLIIEAKSLNIHKYKHSAILLSRTLIQVVLSYIIKSSEQHEKYKADLRRNNYLELDSLLNFFSNNLRNIFPNEIDENVYKLIKSDIDSYKDSGKLLSNLVTHNAEHALTIQEVTHIQVKLQSLMDYFLSKITDGHRNE